jgi:tRNA uridine 5-carboxymethylaminomethyl modification enzyme
VKHSDEHFDVVVIGAGHAGVEAAAAAGRIGAKTALLTHRFDRIGEMSCNPAMGGLGKGHLVREVDALDGLIARASDRAGLQFRMLNRSRGPAVRGPRAQIDRDLYRVSMQELVANAQNVTIVEGEATALIFQNDVVSGVMVSDVTGLGVTALGSRAISACAVVLTTGTFLGGVMHAGEKQTSGGRFGDPASILLADQLRRLELISGKLKTGTPARLKRRSIDFSTLTEQRGDDCPEPFSFLTGKIAQSQVSCYVTKTNPRAHQLIKQNLDRSAMRSGAINGVGPRYCPSIEDKVERFSDRPSHNVFLEPETRDGEVIYPNGISTSLPHAVQLAFMREIQGLEKVEVTRYGYAIAYDYIDPREVTASLELKKAPGLFLAGQIIGTTGYEEAAALGLVAGLNAARRVEGKSEVHFSRQDSYIGVMIDDITTKGVTEPYRMFTSRAEHRLFLRADNADERLTPLGNAVGVVSRNRWNHYLDVKHMLDQARDALKATTVSPKEMEALGLVAGKDGRRRSLYALLSHPRMTISNLEPLLQNVGPLHSRLKARLEAEALYACFLSRQTEEVAIMRSAQRLKLPLSLDYFSISSLSTEQKEKLSRVKPTNLDQARRIEGMTPAALVALSPYATRSAT